MKEEKFVKTFANDVNMTKSAFATIKFLLLSACSHNCDSNVFNAELQQLGLPREHASVLSKILDDHSAALKKFLLTNSLRINDLESFSCKKSEKAIDCIELQVNIKNEIIDGVPQDSNYKVNVHKTTIPILLKELKIVKEMMTNLNFEGKHSI